MFLEARVAGSNVLVHAIAHSPEEDRWGLFIAYPSVANTGPQAIYVREILAKAHALDREQQEEIYTLAQARQQELDAEYMQLKLELEKRDDTVKEDMDALTRTFCERYDKEMRLFCEENVFTSTLSELSTIVVSFDADGNPVCNVDLAKYGLSMPIIVPNPGQRFWDDYSVVFPHETKDVDMPPPTDTTAPALDSAPESKRPGNAETPPPPSPNLTGLYITIGILAIVCAWLGFARRKKK